MSEELSTLEESMKEVFVDLRTKKFMSKIRMSAGVQASSTVEFQVSPWISQGEGASRITTETRTKHRDDITNAKLIPSILPTYIPPLSGAVNIYSVPRDFDHALVTAYLSKGIHAIHIDQDNIESL